MTVTSHNPGRWSHHRWRRTFIGIFLLQLLFVWFLSDQLPAPRQSPSDLGKLSLIPESELRAPLNEILRLMDPTLFAFASSHGFSGDAWFNPQMPVHRLEDKIVSPQPLQADPSFLGRTEAIFPKAAFFTSLQTSEKSELRLMEIAIPQPPICPQSYLELETPLNQRFISQNEILRSWTNKDLLTNTTVQIVVDASGQVISTRLGPGCGLLDADAFAINHAKGLQFQPIVAEDGSGIPPRFPLAWGKIIYHWATMPSTVITNQKVAP